MSHSTPAPLPSPSVTMYNGRPATTSLEVGKFFGKRHDNIVRDIRQIVDNCPESFRALNFEESSYTNEQGKEQPMFIIHRDGFMLLVMGYTGKKAMQIKIAYIEAFNLMEKELAGQQALPPSPDEAPRELTPSTSADRKPIRTLLSAWAILANIEPSVLCTKVRAQFNIRRMEALPAEKVREVQDWIGKQIEDLSKDAQKAYPQIPAAFPDWRTPAINLMTKTPEHPELPIRISDIGLDKEKCLERITHRIEEIRARTPLTPCVTAPPHRCRRSSKH